MVYRTAIAMIVTLWVTSLASYAASAQMGSSETDAQTVKRLYHGDEMFGLKPAFGLNTYNDSLGGRSTRASYGFQTEFNLSNAIGISYSRWFIGPQTGFMFSHLGNADSDFFGADAGLNTGEGGANMFMIPVNLKVAISPIKWMRVGAHGGANVIYRSIASAVGLDDTNLNWRLIPNVGADLDLSLSRNVALSIRPDWTLSSTQSLFSATAALGISLS